eukprot:14474441-Alexandrium_andersonii.AAC.1
MGVSNLMAAAATSSSLPQAPGQLRSCRYSSKVSTAASSESGDLPSQLGWYHSGCSRMWATTTERTRSGPP